ncbi:MAG: isochorismatase family protein [Bradyrhizobium sp.]|uniref:isochorismatase family protein n=1 Tax=Bradyrhizobium sp. TaxID=376 RepID=UPI0012118EAF|nr:isochorismatase family protein [Bradyrhizobium sp.]THD61221.1 MAG: isochorismatase family protein [Bradyrhizobium sp.]
MPNVINLRSHANAVAVPTLVLLDLQQEYIASPRAFAMPEAAEALENCRAALAHSRRVGLPVAFFRMITGSPFFNPLLNYSKWIPGFEPVNSDMIFERSKPSCYANREFANAMTAGGGHFVLAGFSGEAGCLATAIDAFHRDHDVTFLADASASHRLDRIGAATVHETVVQMIQLYGNVTTTKEWISEQTANAAF